MMQEILALSLKADALLFQKGGVQYVAGFGTGPVEGDPAHEILDINWEPDDKIGCATSVTEGALAKATFNPETKWFYMKDVDDEDIFLQFVKYVPLTPE